MYEKELQKYGNCKLLQHKNSNKAVINIKKRVAFYVVVCYNMIEIIAKGDNTVKKRIASLFLAVLMLIGIVAVGAMPVSAASDLKASDDCIKILKQEEGFSKKPYWDYLQYTVGYGSSCPPEMYDHFMANGITEAEADVLLRNHLVDIEKQINTKIIDRNNLTLTQNQFDALVLFSYNCGTSWTTDKNGTLYKAVLRGETGSELIRSFALWCNAGGQIKDYLLRRRLSESNMYLNGIYSKQPPENYVYVLYDANGGSVSPRSQGYDSELTALPFPTPTYSGRTFQGWYTAKTGGTKVTVLDASVGGKTLYARWDGSDADAPETEQEEPVSVKVNDTDVNVRKGPGTNYAVVGTAQKGDAITIVETATGSGLRWGRFGTDKWICLTYTTYDEVVNAKPPADEPEENPEEKPEENPEEKPEEKPAEPEKLKGTVNADGGLRVRKGPGTGYATVKYLANGSKVEILEKKTVGSMVWGKISDGWVSMDYVKLDAASNQDNNNNNNQQTETAKWTGTVVNCNELRIRKGAGTNTAMVGYVKAGTKVSIFEKKTNGNMEWGRIKEGWISLDYVKLDSNTSDNNAGSSNTESNTQKPETAKWTGTVVNCDFLRIRKGAGTSFAQVGELKPGTKVSIFEKKTNGNMVWGRIDKGWISLDYIKLDSTTDNNTDSNTGGNTDSNAGTTQKLTGTVKVSDGDNLRVRSGPGTSYAVAGYLNDGAKVTITEKKTNGNMVWGRIDKGWISLDYVVLDGAGSDTNTGTNTKTVFASCLCVRNDASTNASIVSYLYSGTKVTILETKDAGGRTWGKISSGWIAMEFVK